MGQVYGIKPDNNSSCKRAWSTCRRDTSAMLRTVDPKAVIAPGCATISRDGVIQRFRVFWVSGVFWTSPAWRLHRCPCLRPGFSPGTAFGIYACAVLRHPVRILRLQHLHPGRTGRGQPRRLAGRPACRTGVSRGARRCSTVDTVFVGGGHPRYWVPSAWPRCSTRSATLFPLACDAEITTEANPESTSPAFFETLRAAGYPGFRWVCSRPHRGCWPY